MHEELGALDPDAGTLAFSRTYAHPIDRVWRALTERDQLAVWFPQTVVGDLLTPGAPLRFESAGDGAPGFAGQVLRVEPPRVLEFVWGTDVIRLDLEPGDGACRLTLTDKIDELGKASRDGAGWHACLDLLEAAVDGIEPPVSSMDRWREVHPRYVRAFGPEASSIGPPGSHSVYVQGD